MAIRAVRIVLNEPNIGRMLRSEAVINAMMPYARQMKAAADSGAGDNGHEIKVLQGFDRASVIVVPTSPEAKRAEAEQRNLTTALEAGRG